MTPLELVTMVDRLAAVIREVDGDHTMGAGELAEQIISMWVPALMAENQRIRRELEELRDTMAHNATKIGHDRNEQVEFETHGQVAKDLTRILSQEED